MIKKYLSVIGLALGVLTQQAFAKVVYYDEETETVPIVKGSVTIFRFHEDVKTISQVAQFKIEPADAETPSYSTLSVSPRFSKGASQVSFLLAHGGVVNLKLVVVPKPIPGKTDSYFEFKPQESQIESSNEGTKTTELGLMKAMIGFEEIPGFKIKPVKKDTLVNFEGYKTSLEFVYIGPKVHGYIFKVTNDKKEESTLKLSSLSWGRPSRALLSQVDNATLGPKGSANDSTYLRIVSLPTAPYQNSHLPIAPVKKEN